MLGLRQLTGQLKRWAKHRLRQLVKQFTRRVGRPLARLLAAAAVVAVLQASPAFGQTNVVVFQVDDLGWAQNSLPYSQGYAAVRGDTDTFYETPQLESLASGGVTFHNAYCPSPVCSPSRASLMTGQNPADHHLTQYIKQDWADFFETDDFILNLPAETTTLAEVFQTGGYRTAQVGKWHLGDDGNPAADPLQNGFDVNVGGGRPGKPNRYFADASGSFDLPALGAGSSNPGEYLTDRLTRAATDFIATSAANEEPFFLMLNHYAVHTPIAAKSADVAYYRTKLDDNTYANYSGLSSAEKDDIATYAAMMHSVDESLGSVMTQLNASGVAGNTVVAFISDNGGLSTNDGGFDAPAIMNSPLQSGKGHMYEGGLRGPMVISAPGVSAQTTDALAIYHDLYPTLIQLAGLDPNTGNQDIDGQSLLAVLDGTDTTGRDSVIFHYPHTSNNDEAPQIPNPFSAIRSGDWKLMEIYYENGTSSIELYNITNDIGETNDLSASNPGLIDQLRTTLRDYLRSVDAGMPTGHDLNDPIDPPDSSVLVNFYTSGVDSTINETGMNNMDQNGIGGGQMVRVDGAISDLSITMGNTFAADSTDNDPASYGLGGDNPFDLNGIDPTQTHINGLYDSTGTDPNADGIGTLEITGLNTIQQMVTYDILIWASRAAGSETEETTYSLQGAENMTGPAEYSFIVRDNGEVLIEFTGVSEFGGDGIITLQVENTPIATGAIVLNAMRIDEVIEYVAGDLNLDGEVSFLEAATVVARIGQTGASWADGDMDADGDIDVDDALLAISGYENNPVAPPTANVTALYDAADVPEPTSLIALAVGSAGVLARRRKR